MNLLLDTHVALWAITDNPNLSAKARDLILAPQSVVWVSAVSIWEIAIKHRLGRGEMPVSGEAALRYFRQAGYRFLGIEPDHAKHSVRISAEARTLALALSYIQRLQASRSLEFPMLDRHEVRADDAQHPVRFELSGSWRDSP